MLGLGYSRQRSGLTGRRMQRAPADTSLGLAATRPPVLPTVPDVSPRADLQTGPRRPPGPLSGDYRGGGEGEAPSMGHGGIAPGLSASLGTLGAMGLGALGGSALGPVGTALGAAKGFAAHKGIPTVTDFVTPYVQKAVDALGFGDDDSSLGSIYGEEAPPMGMTADPNAPDTPFGMSTDDIGMTPDAAPASGIGVGGVGSHGSVTGGAIGGQGTSEGADPSGMGAGIGLGGDGDGEGTVLCTHMHEQGYIDAETLAADLDFAQTLPPEVIIGYHLWAIPLVIMLRNSWLLTQFFRPFVVGWAQHMAGNRNLVGKVLESIGVPACYFIGKAKELCRERIWTRIWHPTRA